MTMEQARELGWKSGAADAVEVYQTQGVDTLRACLAPGEHKWDEGAINVGCAEFDGVPYHLQRVYYAAVAAGGEAKARTLLAAAEKESMSGVHCACGEWSGVRCDWDGAENETVLVEFMPYVLRASHVAAGNRGAFPLNGVRRIRVNADCATRMMEADADWVDVVADAAPSCRCGHFQGGE